jgi:hypothetical protein
MKKPRFCLIYFCMILSLAFGIITCSPYSDLITRASGVASNATPTTTPHTLLQRPEGRFLFVEVWRKIEGAGKVPGGPRIDRPTYSFDVQSKNLTLGQDKAESLLATSDWGFLGEGTSMHGTAGGGPASAAMVMEQLPVNTNLVVPTGNVTESGTPEFKTLTVTLYSISAGGAIFLDVGGQSVVLKPDEAWTVTKEILYSSDQYSGVITITSSITNHGWLSMESIDPQSFFPHEGGLYQTGKGLF